MDIGPTRSKIEYQPSLGIRLLGWFGIYFLAELPLWAYRGDILLFPQGLLPPIIALVGQFTASYCVLNSWTIVATYLVYGIHLALTLFIRQRKAFRRLLWLLTALVAFNLWGCNMAHHLG